MTALDVRIRLLALLLGFLLLAGQFHFCADMQAGPSGSHLCPVCTSGSWVVPTVVAIAPTDFTVARLEISSFTKSVLSSIARGTSPRAPPAL
jgi:hypothetical protein